MWFAIGIEITNCPELPRQASTAGARRPIILQLRLSRLGREPRRQTKGTKVSAAMLSGRGSCR